MAWVFAINKTSRTSHAGHNTANVLRNSEQMCDCQGIQQLVLRKNTRQRQKRNVHRILRQQYNNHNDSRGISPHALWRNININMCLFIMRPCVLTGTFFCVTTTTQSFPLTATEVSPPWLMALKAYSEDRQEETNKQQTHEIQVCTSNLSPLWANF